MPGGGVALDRYGKAACGPGSCVADVHGAPGDAAGTLGAESSIVAGGGSQTATLSRWGDYSAITVDPVDDCTFWYTTEYLKSSGTFNWSTRIASFRLPTCQ